MTLIQQYTLIIKTITLNYSIFQLMQKKVKEKICKFKCNAYANFAITSCVTPICDLQSLIYIEAGFSLFRLTNAFINYQLHIDKCNNVEPADSATSHMRKFDQFQKSNKRRNHSPFVIN